MHFQEPLSSTFWNHEYLTGPTRAPARRTKHPRRKRNLRCQQKRYVGSLCTNVASSRSHQKFSWGLRHEGIKNVPHLLSSQYHWPTIVKGISVFVKPCETGQKCKKSKQKRFGLLESLPSAEISFDVVAMDTVGGLADCGLPKRFIHVAVDHTTYYIWAFVHKKNRNLWHLCILSATNYDGQEAQAIPHWQKVWLYWQ